MNLSEFLSNKKPILLDGAMGTQLEKAGLEMGGHVNVTNPKQVLAIHKQYAACGIHLLIANTLTMNRLYIESHNVGVDVREVNLTGVKLAKSAARENQYVLGNLSSTGQLLAPNGTLTEADAYQSFKEQATILAEGGVDGFAIETMFDLKEALCALRACRDAASLPTIVSIAFAMSKKGGRTIMGDSAKECAVALTEGGACAIGGNCGDLDPLQMAEVVSIMQQATSLPILAQPNAGIPKLIGDKTVFDMSPEEFASGIAKCLQAGAWLVGGCCGTSPAHIRAVANILE